MASHSPQSCDFLSFSSSLKIIVKQESSGTQTDTGRQGKLHRGVRFTAASTENSFYCFGGAVFVPPPLHPSRYADAYRNEMVAFVDCAHSGGATPVGVADGRAAYLIGKAAKTSMETGLVSSVICGCPGGGVGLYCKLQQYTGARCNFKNQKSTNFRDRTTCDFLLASTGNIWSLAAGRASTRQKHFFYHFCHRPETKARLNIFFFFYLFFARGDWHTLPPEYAFVSRGGQ